MAINIQRGESADVDSVSAPRLARRRGNRVGDEVEL
jgi:hypothetical protein